MSDTGYSREASMTPEERAAEARLPEPPRAGADEEPLARYRQHPSARGHEARSRWPGMLRRGPMEMLATVIIAAGVIMLMQPVSITLYSYSLVTTLVGTVMFIIVSKFPE